MKKVYKKPSILDIVAMVLNIILSWLCLYMFMKILTSGQKVTFTLICVLIIFFLFFLISTYIALGILLWLKENHERKKQKSESKEILTTPFENDPFAIVFKVFRNLFPNARVDKILWETEIRDDEKGNKVYGLTDFGEDSSVYIFVDANLPVLNAVEILAHELAHAGVGADNDHNEKWEKAFDDIFNGYNEYCMNLYKKEETEDKNEDNGNE